ncbi:MAG: hypothetical protein ACRC2B_23095 [Rubrivivax sp.]
MASRFIRTGTSTGTVIPCFMDAMVLGCRLRWIESTAPAIEMRGAGAMRYAAMQVLTWGTIAGAIGSALLLTVLDQSAVSDFAVLPIARSLQHPSGPTQAGRPSRGGLHGAGLTADTAAASAPQAPGR